MRKSTLAVSALVIALIGTLSISGAAACQCAYPSPDNDERRAWALREADAVFSGDLLSIWRVGSDAGDPLLRATVLVQSTLKGDLPASVIVETRGGENGANCGYASAMLEALRHARSLTFVSFEPKTESDTYLVSYCGSEAFVTYVRP